MILHDVLVDALAEARLEKMHLADRDLRLASPSWAPRTPARGRSWATLAEAREPSPSLRLRLGRALLALGTTIAGEDESTEARRAA